MIKVFSASFNPMYYDAKEIASMDFDHAVQFFKEDKIGCCTTNTHTINPAQAGEVKFMQDGLMGGDTSDAMVVWVKVD